MQELELLSRIYERSKQLGTHVLVGPGDDCAVLQSSAGPLLLTVDQLIEGRHFAGPILPDAATSAPGTPANLVARKAVARSVSDIAAMAGTPAWALATAALPADFPQPLANELFERFAHWAAHFGCPLVGGDIASTPGPALFTVTVGGACHPSRGPVLRSTAKPGDLVFVTGSLGGSLPSGRHLTFEPRIALASTLATLLGPHLHAMIDLSDGLGLDADRIALASRVAIEIDASRVPRQAGITSWRDALSNGEDYELLFTVPPESAATLASAAAAAPAGSQSIPGPLAALGVAITQIGRVLPCDTGTPGCRVQTDTGEWLPGASLGFSH